MTQIVEEIFTLAQKATRAEQYAAVNAILALLEEQDVQLSQLQIDELDRREALLRAGKMPVYTAEEAIAKIQVRLNQSS